MKLFNKIYYSKVLLSLMVIALALSVYAAFHQTRTDALSGNQFDSGNIIDDGVFYYPNTMSVGQIQNFLEDMLDNSGNNPDGVNGSCDTNGAKPSEFGGGTRAQYAASNPNDSVHNPPYICLTQYYENTSTHQNNLRGQPIPSGAKSAAQIIYDVAHDQNINPRVLLVLLQKEQVLITDDWPVEIQYRSATGYGCPDTAACNSEYYGFYNQVYRAAYQFNLYRLNPNSYSHRAGVNNNVRFSPNAACGSSSVYIENQATAGLYNYTPYQPNQAALNNLYGLGDNCSAYGNRNFWRLFMDWFGSVRTNIAYAWVLESQEAYLDSGKTQPFSSEILNLQPGEKAYLHVTARNVGTTTWTPSIVRLGSSKPNDRQSPFKDASWFRSTRPARLIESTVAPGELGTFEFEILAPNEYGAYTENYNLVAEGLAWFGSQNLRYKINVVEPENLKNTRFLLETDDSLNTQEYLLSQDRHSVLSLTKSGNLILYNDFLNAWSTSSAGSGASRLVMQGDGNLVLYNGGTPVWNSQTNGNLNAYALLDTDGALKVFSATDTLLWTSNTEVFPDFQYQTNDRASGGRIFPGQKLTTADRKYRLEFQNDGNLVLYSENGALWANYTTIGKNISFMTLQGDGNLVIYDNSGNALWDTGTNGTGNSKLILQGDGNLVIYGPNGQPTWNTGTHN